MCNLFLSSLCRDFSSKNSKLKQTLWPRITFCCGLYSSLQRETDCSWDWLLNDCRIQIKSYQTKEQRYSHFFHMLQIVKNITRGKKKISFYSTSSCIFCFIFLPHQALRQKQGHSTVVKLHLCVPALANIKEP